MELNNKQVDNAWATIIAVKVIVFIAMVVIFCSCTIAPKGVVVKDIKYHLVFNRAVMHGDTLNNVERWNSIQQGVEIDSIINEQTINAYVIFHNMHLEHNQ